MIYFIIAALIYIIIHQYRTIHINDKAFVALLNAFRIYLETNRDLLVNTLRIVENPQAQYQLGNTIGLANSLLESHKDLLNQKAS